MMVGQIGQESIAASGPTGTPADTVNARSAIVGPPAQGLQLTIVPAAWRDPLPVGFVAVTVMVTGPISAGCDRAPKLIEPVHVPEPALVSEPEPEVVPATQVNFTDVTDPVTFAEMPMTAVKHPGATSTAVGDRVTDVTTGAGTTVDVDGFVVGGLVVGLVAGGRVVDGFVAVVGGVAAVGIAVAVDVGPDKVGTAVGAAVGADPDGLTTTTGTIGEAKSPARACRVCGPTVACHGMIASTSLPSTGAPAGRSPTTTPSTTSTSEVGALSAVACTTTGTSPAARTLASWGESSHTVATPTPPGDATGPAVAKSTAPVATATTGSPNPRAETRAAGSAMRSFSSG